MTQQHQQGGAESTNVQVAGDVVFCQGLSVAETREIALDVFRSNFLDLRGIAEDVARSRAEKITDDFLADLLARLPQGLQAATDPDMQRSLFRAQCEFACSGEADLERILVDLLVDRAGETTRAMRTLVLNEAIVSAPKLTAAQRSAIAVCFVARYTTWRGPQTVDAYYELRIKRNLVALATNLPTSDAAYQHIFYVGAGGDAIGKTEIAAALAHYDPGWFTNGFARGTTQLGELEANPSLVMPCIRNPQHLQLRAMHEDEIDGIAAAAGLAESAGVLRQVIRVGQMNPQEIRSDILDKLPDATNLFDVWSGSMLGQLTLTSVGLAIGHSYWRRITGGQTPLSVWIPD